MGIIKIGKVTGPVGLAGGFKVYDYGDDPARYAGFKRIIIGDKEYDIEKTGTRKGLVFLEVSGICDRNAAEGLRDMDVYIDEGELPELSDGTFYIKDLIGSEVTDEDGNRLGVLADILTNTAQDVYDVKTENGAHIYIPGVSEFILERDISNKRIKVHIIEGMV